MAILKKDEFMGKLKELIGDRTDDEALTIVEDFSETYDSFDRKDEEDWKTKYEENDKRWRERYRNTFFDGSTKLDEDEVIEDKTDDKTILTDKDIFEEMK